MPNLPDAWWRAAPLSRVFAVLGPEALGELLTELSMEHWPAAALGDILPALHVMDPDEADEPQVSIALDRVGSWFGLLSLTGRELADQPFIRARPVLTALFTAVFVRLTPTGDQSANLDDHTARPSLHAEEARETPSRATETPQPASAAPEARRRAPAHESPVPAHGASTGPQASPADRSTDTGSPARAEPLPVRPAPPLPKRQKSSIDRSDPLGLAAARMAEAALKQHVSREFPGAAPGESGSGRSRTSMFTPPPRTERPFTAPSAPTYPPDVPAFGNDVPAFGNDVPAFGNDVPAFGNDVPGFSPDGPGFGGDDPGFTPAPRPFVPEPEPFDPGPFPRDLDPFGPDSGPFGPGGPAPDPFAAKGPAPAEAPEGPEGAEAPGGTDAPEDLGIAESFGTAEGDVAPLGPEGTQDRDIADDGEPPREPEGPAASEGSPAGTNTDELGTGRTERDIPALIDAAFADLDDKTWAVAQNHVFADSPAAPEELAKLFAVSPEDIVALEDELRGRLAAWLDSADAAPYTQHLEKLPGTLGVAAPKSRLMAAADWHTRELRSLDVPAWQFVLATLPGYTVQDDWLVSGDIAELRDQTCALILNAERPPTVARALELVSTLGIHPEVAKEWLENVPQLRIQSNKKPGKAEEERPGDPEGPQSTPTGQLKDVSMTRRCFRHPDGLWWLRVDVAPEQLTGGECPLPSGFAAYLGLSPGESHTVMSAAGEVTLSWQARPVIESLGQLLHDMGAQPGAHLFLTVAEEDKVLRARLVPSSTGDLDKGAVALRLAGHTTKGGPESLEETIRVLATRIGMTGPVGLPDLMNRLRERGDRDLLSLMV
ncbi:hypothetical protein OG589_31470 [Sphaerisporangium sp. NBC_01403]|uniref:hypothetical protein n=1 Tax=Sphaerisporangium sp. NBC_01403 TaxID=2903599 RepID=UPI003247D4C4